MLVYSSSIHEYFVIAVNITRVSNIDVKMDNLIRNIQVFLHTHTQSKVTLKFRPFHFAFVIDRAGTHGKIRFWIRTTKKVLDCKKRNSSKEK